MYWRITEISYESTLTMNYLFPNLEWSNEKVRHGAKNYKDKCLGTQHTLVLHLSTLSKSCRAKNRGSYISCFLAALSSSLLSYFRAWRAPGLIRADNAERVKTPHNCSHYAFLLVKEETISLGGHQRGHTLSGNSLVHTHGGHVYCRQTRRESVSRRSAETRISGFFLSLYNDKNLVPELLPRCPCRKPASHGRYFFFLFFEVLYKKNKNLLLELLSRRPAIHPASQTRPFSGLYSGRAAATLHGPGVITQRISN